MIKVVCTRKPESESNKTTRIKFATKQTPNDYVNEDQR